jgi:YfiH family protein
MKTGDWLVPDWPAPGNVQAATTTRRGGFSTGNYASMNPADHVGDDAGAVQANRRELRRALELPSSPCWLQQVHGTHVVDAAHSPPVPEADAALTRQAGIVCAVLTADCLPVLFCDRAGSVVAAAHAGWRGLAAGVLERTVEAMGVPPAELLAWLGPAISQAAYAVGDEVRTAFVSGNPEALEAFRELPGGWQADLYRLGRQRLAASGVTAVHGGGFCTRGDPDRFYSYRRDGVTGRMASMIWLSGPAR